MSYMHPAALAARRKYWTRPDAYRFAPPGTPEAKMPGWLDPSATRVRLKEAQEEEARAAFAAEVKALQAQQDRLCEMLAELKYELAWRRMCRKYGYNPDQSRAPAGSPQGGQWTSGDGISQSVPTGKPLADGRVLSDESPDPIRPGAQYAQARIEIETSALTGIEDIDRTTVALADRLGKIVDRLPEGSGRAYGVIVHTAFKASLLVDPIPNVTAEPTFGGTGIYGSRDSIRPDAVLRGPSGDIRAFYDVKTGDAGIDRPRAAEFRSFSTSGVPVIELSLRRGVLLKSVR
jgi:hypothetical protein